MPRGLVKSRISCSVVQTLPVPFAIGLATHRVALGTIAACDWELASRRLETMSMPSGGRGCYRILELPVLAVRLISGPRQSPPITIRPDASNTLDICYASGQA